MAEFSAIKGGGDRGYPLRFTKNQIICKQYERFEAGTGRSLEAGTFQAILLAFVAKDTALISNIVNHYRAENGSADSVFLGRVLKLLATGDRIAALKALKHKAPRLDPQFVGYPECFEAIASKNEQAFARGIEIAAASWANVVSKRDRGLPCSVCFIQGAGLVRLAERILGNPISIANKYIPPELIQ